MADNEQNKLLGVLTLDYREVEKAVNKTNEQLAKLGGDVNLDMTSAMEQQFDKLYQKIDKKIKETAAKTRNVSTVLTKSMSGVKEGAENVLSVMQTIGKDGSITKTTTYLDEMNNKCKEIEKNGKLVSKTVTSIGQAGLDARAQKEAQQSLNANLSEQKRLIGEIHNVRMRLLDCSKSEEEGQRNQLGTLQTQLKTKEAEKASIIKINPELEKQRKVQQIILDIETKKVLNADKYEQKQAAILKKQEKHKELAANILSTMSSVISLRAAWTFWLTAADHASKYYDMLNEIRIVTGISEEEAGELGTAYRKMAQDMKVSSTEIAEAATEFWRQGLGDGDVADRTKYATMYAKVAKIEFKEAAELVTAATNSMSIGAGKAVDVFTYLGDASAAGAEEVGTAMQKASASAEEAGLSFEWLGAYIATVSEKTRQAPEVIGTAFNSIMARLQNIKQKGFNEEDSTKINDVAKALKTVDIALMDQSGSWRDMSDIFLDVAEKWATLDDKSRAYLATTIAGTKQKNVFLTLMNDMSKMTDATEEGSRALELYYGALASAGSATEKYATYQESVAAAQAKMNAEIEEFKSLIAPTGVIKGFYDMVAGAVSLLNEGFNSATAIAGALAGVGAAMKGFSAAKSATGFQGILLKLPGSKITITLTAIAAGIALVAGAFGGLKKAMSKGPSKDYAGILGGYQEELETIGQMRDEYKKLYEAEEKTASQEVRMATIVETLAGKNLDLKAALQTSTGEFKTGTEAIEAMNSEYEKQLANMKATAEEKKREYIAGDSYETAKQEYEDALAYAEAYYAIIEQVGKAGGDITNPDSINSAIRYLREVYRKEDPDGVMNAIDSARKEHGNDPLKMMDWLRTYSMDSANANWQAAVEEMINIMFSDKYSLNYVQIGDVLQEKISEYMGGLYDSIGADGWKDMSQSQAIDFAQKAMDEYFTQAVKVHDKMAEYQKIIADPKATETQITEAKNALQEEIDAFNELVSWDKDLPMADALVLMEEKANQAGDAAGKYLTVLEELWKKVEEKNKKDLLQSFSDEKWATHISRMKLGIERALSESGDDGKFLKDIMEQWFSDADLIEAMLSDNGIKWFDDFAMAVKEGDFQKANQILQEGIVATDEEVEKLKEDMQGLVDGQNLDKLKESGFASWIEEIKQYADTKDGVGLFQWLLGKDEKSREAFFEVYPLLAETFNTLTQSEGIVEENAKEWKDLSDTIADANNQYKNWLENKKKDNFENVTDKEGYGAASSLLSAYGDGGVDAIKAFEEANKSLSDSQKDWLYDNIDGYQELIDKINESTATTEDYEKAMKDVAKSTAKWDVEQLEEYGEVLKDMPDWVESCYGGMAAYSESIVEVESAMSDLVKAQGYINGINNGTITSTEHLEEAYKHLSTVTGYSADDLRNNLAPAQAYLANQSVVTGNMVNYFKNQLQAAGAVDFSTANWRAELAALATQLDTDTGKMASFLEVILAANAALGNPTTVEVPKYTGGGRGGGGSGSSEKQISEIEKMLDLMEDIQKIRKHQREMISTTRDYYENEGYLTTAIKYYEDERNAIEENSKVLEENLRKIEALLPAKQREVAAMDTSDKEYEQAAKDLEALQEAHQEYSLELLENKNAIADFNRSIKDMQDEIRDMEIELRETILEAIEDREELNERMLQGTIDVENEILDVITARYEKERDLAIETAEAKIEALERESKILDEQLKKRKEAAEAEDKQAKLAQLNTQLTRISADPTRRKEELELRKQIQELRDEMAWDLAEDEVEAQQESIDQQITSLEDYIEQVEAYYEDLFKHPQKLFEEVKQIMQKTDEEIIIWLKQNSEEYAASSEAAQRDIVNGWNEMIMDMHGQIKDYWDEVEEIVTAGDDAIIAFLKENSADYKEAGKLQAEAYVDQWKQQLDSLKRAYEDFHAEVENTNYESVKPSTGSGSSGSGSSGGSGGTKFKLVINGSYVVPEKFSSYDAAYSYWNENYQDTDKFYITKYAKGGLANFTGPAWLDGTPSAPERILSPYQTKLFEDMISTLHQIKITAPTMPASVFDGGTNNSQAISFGDIILNVDQLASDADYADIVNRLMQEIMERMAQGSAVGGIRVYR